MKRTRRFTAYIILSIFSLIIPIKFNYNTPLISTTNWNNSNLLNSNNDLSWWNATIISDGYNNSYWNNGSSSMPAIIVDMYETIHVVWHDNTVGTWGNDVEIMYVNYTKARGWSNVTVISDGYNNSFWNDGISRNPSIATDGSGKIHVVWSDDTNGSWGNDEEIFYVNYEEGVGWSNITVISDGYSGMYWNDETSINPKIDIDLLGTIHVVWEDWTSGPWGFDTEIMYVNYTQATGWSNVTVISDGYNNSYWNDGSSSKPSLDVDDSGIAHVVWYDTTNGVWGYDYEIFYTKFIPNIGWSNATLISDGYNDSYWNNGDSYNPSISVDNLGTVHVVWRDNTEGPWGVYPDYEIMYANYTTSAGWSNATIISDGYNGSYWNDQASRGSSIVVDMSGTVHVVWYDYTNGEWGNDTEIMYVSYLPSRGWSNVTIVSDGFNGSYWNDGSSFSPAITIDNSGNIHIVWYDGTDGQWGSDYEIMYSSLVCIDLTAPEVMIHAPTNTTYPIAHIWVNVSSDAGDLANIWYRIYSQTQLDWIDATNLSALAPVQRVLTDGYYTLYVWANDTFGNTLHPPTRVNFTIDAPPQVLSISILNGTVSTTGKLMLNISCDAADLHMVWYRLFDGENWITGNLTWTGATTLDLSNGNYLLYIWANDTQGKEALFLISFSVQIETPPGGQDWILITIIIITVGTVAGVAVFVRIRKSRAKKKKATKAQPGQLSSRRKDFADRVKPSNQ